MAAAVVVCAVLAVFMIAQNAVQASNTSQSSVMVSSVLGLSGITLNNASSIILTPNVTTSISANFTVSGGNGCGSVFFGGNVTTTLYRSGVSTTCGIANPAVSKINTLNCYVVATTTHNCASSTSTASANATSTFGVWYFAEATDASTSYASQNWQAYIEIRDASSTRVSSTASGQELVTLLAFELTTSSLNYGTLAAGTDTGSTNQSTTIQNAGNASATLMVHGTAMTSGGNSIATSSQHYATSTFTYGGAEQQLQAAAAAVSGWFVSRPTLANWTTNPTPLPAAVTYVGTVAYNSFLYTVGGDLSGTELSGTGYSQISPSGTLLSIQTGASMPAAVARMVTVAHNGYLYAIGGQDTGNAPTSSVNFAVINGGGDIGSWLGTASMNAPRANHRGTLYNGYVYAVGGATTGGTVTSSVEFAALNATGSISSWTRTASLPTANGLYYAPVLAYNDYLYVFGGTDNGGSSTSTVYYAHINATGSVSNWSTTTALPYTGANAGDEFVPYIDSGIFYLVGGYAPTPTSSVIFNMPQGDGTLGPWSFASFPLPAARTCAQGAFWNGRIYLIGGAADSCVTRQTAIYHTSAMSRNLYWGTAVPGGQAGGDYESTITYTAVFSP